MNEPGQDDGDLQFAPVEAVLALSFAVSHPAEVYEALAETVGDLARPQPGLGR